MGDEQKQDFKAMHNFSPVFDEYMANNLHGLIIAGDVNAHAREWDVIAEEVTIGGNVMNFIDEYGLMVMNDSLPTYHSFVQSNINATPSKAADSPDKEENYQGRIAPEKTFYTNNSICVTNWQHQHPIGQCHHYVLSCTINFGDFSNPLMPHQ